MVKRVMVCSLTEGTDPDEFWKYWVEVHAAGLKNEPGIKKYVIHRVTKVAKGEPKFWGLMELWFDSEEDYKRIFANKSDEYFASHMTERFAAWVEEKVII